MKRFITGILIGIMLISSLSVSASANFTDVKQGDWYYETVTEMTEKGLFKGKGNNMFCPNDTMTKAEFITVVMRILYPDIDLTSKTGQAWWQGAYDMALAEIITPNEFPVSTIEQTISRQEMALVSVKALMMRGETFFIIEDLDKKIPDYNQIGKSYTMYVEMAYSMGILCGVDSKGTFAPLQTLTRAQGATVLYRLVNESKRQDSTPFDNASGTSENITAPITIYEGQYRNNRNAKEGDTFVKADGTKIVLKKGPNGILGEGQGVAPDVGLNLGLYTVKSEGGRFGYNPDVYGNMFDSTGANLQNQTYYINRTTGEGYWGHEVTALEKSYPKPDYEGSYDGQVTSDNMWEWLSGMWFLNFSH